MKLSLHIVVLIAAAIAIALLADAWHSARHDSEQLAATLKAQNSSIQQATERENQRDTQLSTALSAIQSQKRAVQTPKQASEQLAAVLPTLPLPVTIHDPDLSGPLAPGESPSTTISIPQPDLVPLYDGLQDCRENKAQSDALQKDLSDEKLRSAAMLHERDAAIATAHGGAFLTRVIRSAKWLAIGIAVGAAAAATIHH
ncbi:MAG TPA: hypothetical protein VK709_16185 [Candidatus Saccharimonadales bacterium]|jgi:hypothetical protein|nr:hypothetical protein [Candidatus Saccharimonadales bacterium]